MNIHAPLQLVATYVRAGVGIMRIDVRCMECGESLSINRDGLFIVDTPCGDEGHVIPEMIFEPADGGDLHDGPPDVDKVNALLNGSNH